MNKKTLTIILFFVFAYIKLQAQTIEGWTQAQIDAANTGKNESYLSAEEKNVILYTNLARTDGKLFTKTLLKKFIDERSFDKKNSYYKSLVKDLESVKNLTCLKPLEALTKTARYHAKDMGKVGKIGHNSTNGDTFVKRLRKVIKQGYISENCSYGYPDGFSIVVDLLIDDGIPTLGHRKNILNAGTKYIGTAIEPHKTYRQNCVMDFSDSTK